MWVAMSLCSRQGAPSYVRSRLSRSVSECRQTQPSSISATEFFSQRTGASRLLGPSRILFGPTYDRTPWIDSEEVLSGLDPTAWRKMETTYYLEANFFIFWVEIIPYGPDIICSRTGGWLQGLSFSGSINRRDLAITQGNFPGLSYSGSTREGSGFSSSAKSSWLAPIWF